MHINRYKRGWRFHISNISISTEPILNLTILTAFFRMAEMGCEQTNTPINKQDTTTIIIAIPQCNQTKRFANQINKYIE